MALGAGRQRVEDAIDPAAGVVVIRKPGECVRMGEPVLELRHNGVGAHLDEAVALCSEGVELSTAAPELPPLVMGLVS
jgi:thymidine phosphorylase